MSPQEHTERYEARITYYRRALGLAQEGGNYLRIDYCTEALVRITYDYQAERKARGWDKTDA